jgi:hypothetical protein
MTVETVGDGFELGVDGDVVMMRFLRGESKVASLALGQSSS